MKAMKPNAKNNSIFTGIFSRNKKEQEVEQEVEQDEQAGSRVNASNLPFMPDQSSAATNGVAIMSPDDIINSGQFAAKTT